MSAAFIGCKISLISKSEIRYEGILYTIDTKESTIALAKVRSFGTEDRPTDKPVAPRSEVYEYIIFRASDIKDLIVDDPPAASSGLSDPAIIQAQSTGGSASTSPAASVPTSKSGAGASSTGNVQAGKQTLASVLSGGTSSSQHSRKSPTISSQQSSSPTNEHIKRGERQNQQGVIGGQNRDRVFQRDGGNFQQNSNNRGRRDFAQGQQQPRGPRQGGQFQQHGQLQQQPHYGQRQFGQQQQNLTGGMGGMGGGFRGSRGGQTGQTGGVRGGPQRQGQQNYYNNRPQRGGQQQNRPPKEDVTKLDPYDFEKANQEFSELENKFTELGIDESKIASSEDNVTDAQDNEDKQAGESPDGPVYDKAKSFFDTISCEAIERSKGNVQRVDRRVERKMNEETFGVGGIRSYRGRGGYNRGYGSNRGFSGGRGYSNRGGYFRRGSAGTGDLSRPRGQFGSSNGTTDARKPQTAEN